MPFYIVMLVRVAYLYLLALKRFIYIFISALFTYGLHLLNTPLIILAMFMG